ncbi:hypothetical protein Nepgr_013090 [Nepenthes gracilis]|uniref:AB hydrolase-1 domain-containing protein n=1 Tax=Nepenthes gracilis TaxID=150966 RepID=A0AAD3XNT3_NEPGR|nr:hypothetical protein Nepgr_013090 [Nepenthes gracilis]
MSETDERKTWQQELASLVDYTGTMSFDEVDNSNGSSAGAAANVRETISEFSKGAVEMSVELVRSFVEIVKQSLGDKNSFVVRKFGKPCGKICGKLRFLNDYLPEDRDPVHSWGVIFSVFVVAFLALSINTAPSTSIPLMRKVYIHPPNASLTPLPDGRHLAYHEQGVPTDRARFSIIAPHSFLSSRLAGIPGLKTSLMEEFGVRLITYDLPGFGESDPHPHRNLKSSALDMLHVADALGVNQKFWVMGYSDGSMHVWAALRYIPDRLAGAALFAPMVNPYDPSMTKEERLRTWEKWTPKRKLMYILARKFPGFLGYFFRGSFLSGRHGPVDKWLSLSLGKRDRSVIEEPWFEEFWQRNVEESIRQGNAKPFVEEAILQVSDWGFNIADLQTRKSRKGQNILLWLKSMYSRAEEDLTGFLGPIHIWQGMDDQVVPPSITSFLHRVLPGASVHMLPNDGHFTYYFFCDECHRHMFATLFGTPQVPLQSAALLNQAMIGANTEDKEEATIEHSAT